jgi:hypothetical protein
MPYAIRIDPAARLVEVVASGPSNLEETRQVIADLASAAGYEPDFRILVDARTQSYVASFADLLALRDQFEGLRERFRGPIAVVLDDPVRYGATRGLAGMTGLFGIRLGAFRDLGAARAWLAEPR